jgi:hypothetical protein
VVILNASKIKVTGKKEEQKLYYRNSQRPGSLKIETFKQVRDRVPTRILEKAIWGMLPKGVLGRQYYKRLYVYASDKIVYKKIENIIEKMQDDSSGVPIRTVKSFMSKIPSVFTGSDLIQWMHKKLDVEDTCEALHFAHLIASHGYMFPIDDHILTVKNDGTFFRFQVASNLHLKIY